MSDRNTISECISVESFYDILEKRTPEQVISVMKDYMIRFGDRNISFKLSPYGYDGGMQVELWETRLENDTEFEYRLKQEKKYKEIAEKKKKTKDEKDFAEYQRLQKKFEGKSV